MQSRIDDVRALGAVVLAVSPDSIEENRRLAEGLSLDYRLLSDPELKLIDAWGLRHEDVLPGRDSARPAVFVLDGQGRVRWSRLTDNWRVRVRPDEVIDALREIGAGAS